MFLRSIATANPRLSLSQAECWELATRSKLRDRISFKSLALLRRVLTGATGIERRHFAVEDLENVFDLDADSLNHAYVAHAPALAATALEGALERAGLMAADIDALFVCTCTGYLCPGVSSYVAERMGMAPHVYLHDLVGMGCGAAIPMLRAASGHLAAAPGARVACIAVEVCSAAFYIDDDPGVIISACLFGDGAAATIWTADAPGEGAWRCGGFDTVHQPENRDCLRFETRNGKLRNLLSRDVPEKAAAAVKLLHNRTVAASGTPGAVLTHAGGRDVVLAVEQAIGGSRLEPTWEVLRQFGNMSSPSVLFALEHQLAKNGSSGDDLWLTSFGAGFAAHGCRLKRES
jgi:alkylresorcinol/alkylpyrone synthase